MLDDIAFLVIRNNIFHQTEKLPVPVALIIIGSVQIGQRTMRVRVIIGKTGAEEELDFLHNGEQKGTKLTVKLINTVDAFEGNPGDMPSLSGSERI